MKKLILKSVPSTQQDANWLESALKTSTNKTSFVRLGLEELCNKDIEFYKYVGTMLEEIGFNAKVTREGDTNLRFDATIIDSQDSIPIEIKSPREDKQINIKSIRQALENKIVMLSRKFYPTKRTTTSLVIALNYPASRSDVYELIEDIYSAWGFNIGVISTRDLLRLTYAVRKGEGHINKVYIQQFKGRLIYEKAIY